MAKISDSDIAQYARNAGVTGHDIAVAVAIAIAESSGNTTDHNTLPPDDSYGLWQINMFGSLGPDRRKKLALTNDAQLFDPTMNARAMFMISNGGHDWTPWSTYTSGKYRVYLARGEAVMNGTGDTTGTVQTVSNALPSISGIAHFFDNITNPSVWRRVLIATGGMLLLVFAVMHGTGDNTISETTKGMVKTAAKVAGMAAL